MTIFQPVISPFFGKREIPIYQGPFTLKMEGSMISAEGEIQMAFGHANFIQLEGALS